MKNTPQQPLTDPALLAAFEDTLVKMWHESSPHYVSFAIPFGHFQCDCREAGGRLRELLAAVLTAPFPEPAGLGAVVSNPLTGGTWVRSTHPRLPNPEPTGQDWSDPYGNRWYTFGDLPLPLLVRADGWTPPGARGEDE